MILGRTALVLSLVMAGCSTLKTNHDSAEQSQAKDSGGVTSGGLPTGCHINLLVGRSYAGAGTTIDFFADGKAGYGVAGDDERFVVSYTAQVATCLVTLTDADAPGLSNGRTFSISKDMKKLSDTSDQSLVLLYTGGGEICSGHDTDASLIGKTFVSKTGISLRFIDGEHFSFDDGRAVQTYTVAGGSLTLHIHDGGDFDQHLTIQLANKSLTLKSDDPIEGSFQRIGCSSQVVAASAAVTAQDTAEASASGTLRPALTALADAANSDPWVAAPAEFDSASLARIILSGGKVPGALLAVLPSSATKLDLWLGRYDVASHQDVAHIIGYADKVGLAEPLANYAERIPLAPVEPGTPPVLIEQIPAFVKKAGDSSIYVRWQTDNGVAALFKVRGK